MIASEPSPEFNPCSLDVPLSELALELLGSGSLGLLVLVELVRGELAGDADFGDGRGCWCMMGLL